MARRSETVTAYVLSGAAHGLADMWCPEARQNQLFLHELGVTPGLTELTVSPVLRYIQTLTTWNPGVLTTDELAALGFRQPADRWPRFTDPVRLDHADRALMRALSEDGRRTYDELARSVGVSERTAARRVDALRTSGLITIRAVVDPRLLGLPTAAFLRLRVRPDQIERVADQLAASPYVRYAAMVLGTHQIVADVRVPHKEALRTLLTNAPWTTNVDAVDASLILDVLKQSEILSASLR